MICETTKLSEMERQLQHFLKNKMFEAHHMNWGLKGSFSKEWDESGQEMGKLHSYFVYFWATKIAFAVNTY